MQTVRSFVLQIAAVTAVIVIVGGLDLTGSEELSAQEPLEVTAETIEQWRIDLSNWGTLGRQRRARNPEPYYARTSRASFQTCHGGNLRLTVARLH